MTNRQGFFGLAAMVLLVFAAPAAVCQEQTAPAQGAPGIQPPQAPATPGQAPASTPATSLPAPGETQQGSAPLRVMVGKSLLINTTERLKRVSVTDPAVADTFVVTPTQILVHGRAGGFTWVGNLGRAGRLGGSQ